MHADLNQDGLQDDHVQPSLEKSQTFPRIAFSRRLVFLFPWTRISSMQEDDVHPNSVGGCVGGWVSGGGCVGVCGDQQLPPLTQSPRLAA